MPLRRREFIKTAGLGAVSVGLAGSMSNCRQTAAKPNIIYILADDLGYNELGCYGQKKIRTANIDRLAAEGMKFSQHYSGSPVCAPSRCTLLTGKHTGNSYIRDNDELSHRGDVWRDPELEGQRPLPAGTETIGTILQRAGYVTGAIGKWGLGGPGSSGEPNRQGFDHFYGYLCQRVAHNYYPTHLWRNGKKEELEGNPYFFPHQRFPEDGDAADPEAYSPYSGKTHATDKLAGDALNFIRENRDHPFFLYLAYNVPHVSLQVPEESLAEYEGAFPETPYLGEKGYLPHRTPRAAYAAMISQMDRHIGGMMALIKELNLDEQTLVIFTSDNGPTFNGGSDSAFFESAHPLRGLKCEVYDGGIRVPMIARWPGRIRAGSSCDHVSAFWDVLPTLAEIAGTDTPAECDGISFLPSLLGSARQKSHEYLYWEYHSYRGRQAVRMGDWKGVRLKVSENREAPLELYNLKTDISESRNVADENPDIVEKIDAFMKLRSPSFHPDWNFEKK